MEARLLNCPFCGGRALPNIDRWVNITKNGVIYCAACDFTLPPTVWNRRTPDLTEALARLKALEEKLRDDGTYYAPDWAKEIAAIRKALGASDAEPTPEPEP